MVHVLCAEFRVEHLPSAGVLALNDDSELRQMMAEAGIAFGDEDEDAELAQLMAGAGITFEKDETSIQVDFFFVSLTLLHLFAHLELDCFVHLLRVPIARTPKSFNPRPKHSRTILRVEVRVSNEVAGHQSCFRVIRALASHMAMCIWNLLFTCSK